MYLAYYLKVTWVRGRDNFTKQFSIIVIVLYSEVDTTYSRSGIGREYTKFLNPDSNTLINKNSKAVYCLFKNKFNRYLILINYYNNNNWPYSIIFINDMKIINFDDTLRQVLRLKVL